MQTTAPPTWVKIRTTEEIACPPYLVEYFESSIVRRDGYCNTTNHHDLAPPDWPSVATDKEAFMKRYNVACEPFMYSVWAEPLGMQDYLVVSLPRSAIFPLTEAGRVSILTGKLPSHLDEDIQDFADTIDLQIKKAGAPWSLPGSEFFVRLDDCSPKDNGGLRPLKNGKEILTAILGSKRCMLRIEYGRKENLQDLKIILKLWRPDVDIANEFRVFVNEGKITAISQYSWFEDHGWGVEPKKSKIPHVIRGISDLLENIKPFLPFTSCVYDTHVMFRSGTEEEGEGGTEGEHVVVELVEFNPFGAHISSGSALFHWVRDFDVLNGVNSEKTPIHVRFVQDPK